ncbi:MAG TPA: transcriptional regulator [Terracidiphilus sp.]|nr:transcriptional regulator [Terracidiphilus sp.]
MSQTWAAVGPDGGDARAFGVVPGHPEHLYLGTTDSWIYESNDGGQSWHRLARLDGSDDLVIDHIVVDEANPAVLYAAAWRPDRSGGGVWTSRDGGRSWSEEAGMRGESIRAFVQAPSNPDILFAGTLTGVFRSEDGGATWSEISPPGSREIHEVESLAVDPVNPGIVYAGTWHLPWKTMNGGKTWHSIKRGVIDDSDVFSILLDPERPRMVYASACSGIYKSLNGGELFRRIQGIPSTARRTRVLKQDPRNRAVVYAGTTEGLFKTVNGGRTFQRMTGPDVIINDVYVDPANPQRVLLATDRSGVLASEDGGASFTASNHGISQRKVAALLVDAGNPQRMYAGVVNDKSYGSAFVSSDGGAEWQQMAAGLDGRDVFALGQSPKGALLAGTNDGLFAWNAEAKAWQERDTIANVLTKTATETVCGERVNVERRVKDAPRRMEGRVYAIDLSGEAWLVSSDSGVFTSSDEGATWQGGPVMGVAGYLSVTARGKWLAAARPNGVVYSKDCGRTWWPMGIPLALTRIHRIAFSPDGTLWLGAREGVYFTRDLGKSWMWVHRLPLANVDDLYYDAAMKRVLVASRQSDFVFAIDPATLGWKWWQTGYRLAAVRSAEGRVLAASLDNGVLVEPRAAAGEVGER